ncbi:MAG: L-rhamnose mutarotase [Maribacter sp.]
MSYVKRLCFSCDLKDNPDVIGAYKKYHAEGNAWPEITSSIKDAGITDMQIYLTGNRMFMIMEVDETFDPIKKAEMDAANPKVQEWENLMWDFQQALPWAKNDEKWIALEQIFQLEK